MTRFTTRRVVVAACLGWAQLTFAHGNDLGAALLSTHVSADPAVWQGLGLSSQSSTEASRASRAEAKGPPQGYRECRENADCVEDAVCFQFSDGTSRCARDQARQPAATVIQRGAEITLRNRAVQLKEELALGRGPLIDGLAALHRVDRLKLGRTLRAHRLELAKLITAGEWAPAFLVRVDQLLRPGLRLELPGDQPKASAASSCRIEATDGDRSG